MKRVILASVVILALFLSGGPWFLADFALAKKDGEPAYHITWSPPKISRSISPGYSWDGDLTFTSDIDLSNAELFITPELQPFISVFPQSLSSITASTPNVVRIDIVVPPEAVPDTTYEGTLQLKVGHRTYPQSLKVVLYIAAPLETVTEETYNKTDGIGRKAINDFYELKPTYGADQAREMVISWLSQQPEVVDAGVLDNGDIWVTYKIGLDCVISTAPPGMNGSSGLAINNGFTQMATIVTDITPGNRKAIVLSPFYSQPLRPNPSDEIRDTLSKLNYDITTAYDENVTVNLVKTLYQYGVVDWSTHGGKFFGKVMLATGEEAGFLSFYSHILDVLSFRIMERRTRYDYEKKIDKRYWVILPRFIKHYATQPYPNSLIHTDACYGLANTTMADAFIDNGAYVYLGWNSSVYASTATEVAECLFHYLADGMTVRQACEKIKGEDETRAGFNFYPSDHGDLSLRLPEELSYVPDDYTTIQKAVDAASPGDTIIVRDGIYTENVDVNKSLAIKSENGADSTIVQAANPYDHVFEVTADYVDIGGFTVKGATGWPSAGIYLPSVNYCNISDNNIAENCAGIYLENSRNNTITGNDIPNNWYYGIRLGNSRNNTITENSTSDTGYNGIELSNSSENVIANNTFIHDGLFVLSSQNTVENNMVNGKPLVYLEGVSDYTVPPSAGQVILVNCDNITVENLDLDQTTVGIELWGTTNSRITKNKLKWGNMHGIYLGHSSNNNVISKNIPNGYFAITLDDSSSSNRIIENNVTDCCYGICLWGSSNNTLMSNSIRSVEFKGIPYNGIELRDSSNNTLMYNTVSNGGNGIFLSSSSSNTLYLNNLIDNTDSVYSSNSTNTWNSPEEITYTYNGSTYTNYLGNYWSDYTGSDTDGDGIGDTPYNIDSDRDNYLLMEPFESYIFE